MLMNRIAPSSSDLYIANADGSGERKLFDTPALDYNASFASDGENLVFTSERNGDGNSDVFRCRVDGTDAQPLVVDPAVDDAAVLSPVVSHLAFVSTRDGYRANVWVMDLRNGAMRNLTGAANVRETQATPIASCVHPGRPTGSGWPFPLIAIPIGGVTMGARVGSIRKS